MAAIKEKYETKVTGTLNTSPELLKAIEADIVSRMDQMVDQMETVLGFIRRIHEIAVRLDPNSKPLSFDYVRAIILVLYEIERLESGFSTEKTNRVRSLFQTALTLEKKSTRRDLVSVVEAEQTDESSNVSFEDSF